MKNAGGESLDSKDTAAVRVQDLLGAHEHANMACTYKVEVWEVLPEYKADYDAALGILAARGETEHNIRAALANFPMRRIAERFAHNVVAWTGKNSMLDNYIAGSSFTQTGPYMGLISSVSWTNLSTTISSGTYTSGAVSLTTGASHGLNPGDTFTLSSVTGTGSYTALNSSFVATTGTTGTTLNFSIVPNLTMTITGGNVTTTSGTRIADTMSSHGNWTEAGSTNAPTFSARGTPAWSSASNGSKSTSSAVSFTMTGAGTLEGCFLVCGSGAVTTLMSTAGTLFSAGVFTGGAQTVSNGNVVTVSYTLSI